MLERLPQARGARGGVGGSLSVLHVVVDPSPYLPTGTHHCLQVRPCLRYLTVALHFTTSATVDDDRSFRSLPCFGNAF